MSVATGVAKIIMLALFPPRCVFVFPSCAPVASIPNGSGRGWEVEERREEKKSGERTEKREVEKQFSG
jgi:hypothetical protein